MKSGGRLGDPGTCTGGPDAMKEAGGRPADPAAGGFPDRDGGSGGNKVVAGGLREPGECIGEPNAMVLVSGTLGRPAVGGSISSSEIASPPLCKTTSDPYN